MAISRVRKPCYNATMPDHDDHLPPLLYCLLVAMVLEYQYFNNDLHYVVDDPPYVEC